MAFNTTNWEYSNVTTEEKVFAKPEEGERYLKINNAIFDGSDKRFTIFVTDLGNNAEFSLSYWLNTNDRTTNDTIPNTSHRNALVSLGKALAGHEIGIPNPNDVVGGVVLANIVLKESKTTPDKKFARCFKFQAVPEDMAILADIDQYYIGAPTE